MNLEKTTILKVLVGSRAHGLADKDSDYDYRAVYVLPTSKILSLGYKYKGNDWIEGKEDNTAYEIGHFLQLAIHCNPTILEVFKAPIAEADNNKLFITKDGMKLRELFPYVWSPKRAFDAFVGYGLNQRKKFLDKKDNRQNKYAVAYIRTLYNLIELLDTENFNVKIPYGNNRYGNFKDTLIKYKAGQFKFGEVIDLAELFIVTAQELLPFCTHEPNLDKVNEFLIDIRKRYW